MTKQSYYDLLKHPQWQKKRLEIMGRAGFRCEHCGEDEMTLNVHHGYYEKGLNPWEYPEDTLTCLCEPCHKEITDLTLVVHRQMGRLNIYGLKWLLKFIPDRPEPRDSTDPPTYVLRCDGSALPDDKYFPLVPELSHLIIEMASTRALRWILEQFCQFRITHHTLYILYQGNNRMARELLCEESAIMEIHGIAEKLFGKRIGVEIYDGIGRWHKGIG